VGSNRGCCNHRHLQHRPRSAGDRLWNLDAQGGDVHHLKEHRLSGQSREGPFEGRDGLPDQGQGREVGSGPRYPNRFPPQEEEAEYLHAGLSGTE
jgi:hypothetical protein